MATERPAAPRAAPSLPSPFLAFLVTMGASSCPAAAPAAALNAAAVEPSASAAWPGSVGAAGATLRPAGRSTRRSTEGQARQGLGA